MRTPNLYATMVEKAAKSHRSTEMSVTPPVRETSVMLAKNSDCSSNGGGYRATVRYSPLYFRERRINARRNFTWYCYGSSTSV